MSRKLLMPLDGSKRAERALSYVPAFVDPKHTSLDLMHVLREADEKEEQSAARYLEGIAKRCEKMGVQATVRVVQGDPAVRITQEAEALGVDLVILCTHGKTGPSDRYLGDFAAALSHSCPKRLMLVRPEARTHKGGPLTAVCPLIREIDLRKLEEDLEALFSGTKTTVHLVSIGRPFVWSLGGIPAVAPRPTEELKAELDGLSKRLRDHHVYVKSVVTRGDPEEETLKVVKKVKADLVLAPTTRVLLFGWRLGPVASHILSRTKVPVVLLR